MPDAIFPTVILSLGSVGYQTDMPTQTRSLTHYVKADNIVYEVGKQVRKFGGAEKINSVAMNGAVTGVFDFWFGGGATAFSQKFIAVTANSKIYKEDMDGTFDDITGAATITAGAIPVFGVATNLLVVAFNTRDPILRWDGAAAAVSVLGGTAPLGKGFIFHKNRGFIWDGSTLYYSIFGNVEDWVGADSGSIVFDEGDGDEIIGCVTYKENLIVFKGPNKGSIHVLTGSNDTGADAFARTPLLRQNDKGGGIPLQSHNDIVAVGDDIAFRSPRGIHLLSAVQQFGDYAQADLTPFLKQYFRDLNRTNAKAGCGVNYVEKSCVFWATTPANSSTNTQLLGLSYANLQEDGWKPFTVTRDCSSVGIRKHPTTKLDEVVTGNSDGFCRRQDTTARAIDTTIPYSFNLTSPRLLIGQGDASGKPRGDQPAVLESAYLRSESVGDYPLTGHFIRDNLGGETYSFHLGAGGAGFLLDTSVLDVDSLADTTAMEIAYSEPAVVGECRSFKFTLAQSGLNQDAKLSELGIEYTPAGQTRTSPVQRD